VSPHLGHFVEYSESYFIIFIYFVEYLLGHSNAPRIFNPSISLKPKPYILAVRFTSKIHFPYKEIPYPNFMLTASQRWILSLVLSSLNHLCPIGENLATICSYQTDFWAVTAVSLLTAVLIRVRSGTVQI
jgi:hypothetical protein